MTAAPLNIQDALSELLRRSPDERMEGIRAHPDLDWFIGAIADHLSSAGGTALEDLGVALEACATLHAAAGMWASPSARTRMIVAHAHVLSYATRFDEALAVLDEARSLRDNLSDPGDVARVHLGRVQPLARLGRFDEAIEEASLAAEFFGLASDSVRQSRAFSNLGVLQRMRERPDLALPLFNRALRTSDADPALCAQIESNRAEALMDLHRFDEASAAFERALERLDAIGLRRASVIVRGNLADLHGRQGRYASSLAHYEATIRSLEADSASGDRARLEAERSEVLASVGLLGDAVEGFASATVVLDARGLAIEAARARLGMGGALLGLHDLNAAREALEDAASRFERVGAHRGRARATLMLARIALRERRIDDADALLLTARRDDEPPLDRILREQAVASLDAARGEHSAALERIASAMLAAQALGHAPLIADLLYARATSLAALNDRAGALDTLRHAADQIERVRGTLQGDLLRVAYLSTRREAFDDKVRLALDLGGDDGAALAFEIAERSRSRTLLDLMQHGVELAEHFTSLASDEERPLVEGLVRARHEMNALYVSLDKGKHADPSRWSARVAEVEAQISRLERRLAFTRRFSALAGRTRSLEEVQRALPHDAAFVQWFDDGDRVGCFVVRREASAFLSLAPTRDVRLACELLRLQIARALRRPAVVAGRPGTECSALRTLHTMLVAPILPECADAATIVFAPSATLHGVPFHALTDEHGRFLIESVRVASITSASVMLECMDAQRGPESSGRSLVVAHGDERAPEVHGEAIEIARLLGEPALLVGEDARFDAIERDATSLSLLHISGHGVFDESAPMSAGLRLADRWMSARDVFRLRLDACDVVLGCCDAGRGATLKGDELLGLSRAFLAAGAKSVLAPLWPLEDASARLLLTRTYQLWLDSNRASILDAITLAQREAIAEGVHPCLWASFQFVGAP